MSNVRDLASAIAARVMDEAVKDASAAIWNEWFYHVDRVIFADKRGVRTPGLKDADELARIALSAAIRALKEKTP
jgi:hypothetical protein